MLKKTLNKFRQLSVELKSIIYLFWIYELIQIIVALFIEVFVYLQTQSLAFLMVYSAVYFIAIMLGFCAWGYIMAQRQISMRYNYLYAYLVYLVSFLILLIAPHSELYLLLFAFLNGLFVGIFWLSMHFYELKLTHNNTRDFYSSMGTLGSQVFTLLSPLIATLSFYISKLLDLDTFGLLFIILPIFVLFSLPFLFKLPNMVPERIRSVQVKRLFLSKELSKARTYYFWQGMGWGFFMAVVPIIAIQSLETVINIGILQTVIALLSIFVVMILSHLRHQGNRLNILFYALILFLISYCLLLFWDSGPYFYIAYLLINVFASPLWRVSEHLIDLDSVENMQDKNTEFFAALIYRDFILFVGRIMGLVILTGFYFFIKDEIHLIKIAICLTALSVAMTYLRAKKMLKVSTSHPQ